MRSRSPSFISTRATWVFTVASPTPRSVAISAFDRPRASNRSTSVSRGVSSASSGGAAGPGRPAKAEITRVVTAGSSRASPPATTRIAVIRCSGDDTLSRKPLAPACNAR
jgi:hypothetical protein